MKSEFRNALLATALASAVVLAQALPASAEQVELTMWHQHPEWKARAEAIIAKFEEAYPDIKINLEEIAGTNYSARLNTALAAGEAPDIFGLPAGPETAAAAKAGYLYDITDKVDTSNLTQSAKDAIDTDGHIYGLPILGSYTVALYYHRDKMAELGITPPANQAEFMKLCAKLKDQGIPTLIVPAQDGIVPSFIYSMLVASVLGPDGFADLRAGKRKFTDPDVVKAAAFLQDMYPCFQDGSLSTPYVEGKALAAMGRGPMMSGGSADYAGYQEINPNVDLGVVPFPAVDGGKPGTVTGMEYIDVINAKSAHKDAALTFLQWMMGNEPQQMVVDTITMSTNKNVVPSNNRIMKEMVEASHHNDIRVFYELPETSKTWSVAQQNTSALFLKEITPEEFSARMQAAVVTSGN